MKTYSTKANANRAAKQAGLNKEDVTVIETSEGSFYYEVVNVEEASRREMGFTKAGDSVPVEDVRFIDECGTAYCPHCNIHLDNGMQTYDGMLDAHNNSNPEITPISHQFLCLGCGEEFGDEVKAPEKVARPKLNKSTIENPCKVVWDISEEMTKQGYKRKDVLNACVEKGIAYYTARTQYQAWKAASKA